MSESEKGKGRGCWFYGCLTLAVLVVVGGVGLFFAGRYAINKIMDQYTSTTPAALPKVEFTDDAYKDLQKRLEDFGKAMKHPEEPLSITLTADEINALIARDVSCAHLKGKVHVAMEGDQLKGTISWPLDELGIQKLKGRFMNGAAGFKVVLANGRLFVNMDSLTVNGQTVPDQYMTGIRAENLAKDIERNPEQADFFRKLESIEIKDGKLTVKVKGKSGSP